MLIKYKYPVASSLFLREHWPVIWGDYQLEWKVAGGRVEAVTIAVKIDQTKVKLPSIVPSQTPGVSAEVNIGDTPFRDEVDQMLRTMRGILSFFSHLEIDFERPTIEWVAESDEEREALRLYSFSHSMVSRDPMKPRTLSYEMVVRAITSAQAAGHYEIPMSFISKADRDRHAGRFIEAFYSLFFFLETLFAPGYSDPKKVKERFKNTEAVVSAIADVRSTLPHMGAMQKTLRSYWRKVMVS